MTRSTLLAALLLFSLQIAAVETAGSPRRRPVRPITVPGTVVVSDDFRLGARDWEAGFGDYSPLTDREIMELDAGIRPLPAELGINGSGYYITGHNRSDDLFMFLSKKLTTADGIRPNQQYEVSFRIVLASNAGGAACGGIGGHPGYSVYLKAGGAGEKPVVALDDQNHFRLNLDKGNQSTGGPAATVAGHVSNENSLCTSTAPFTTIERTHKHPFLVTSNPAGELWLLVGTDSGFEGKTVLYYQSVTVTITPR